MSRNGNIRSLSDPRSIEMEAAVWAVRLEDAKFSDEDQDAFEEWRARSPRHAETADRLIGMWQATGALQQIEAAPIAKPTFMERIGFEYEHRAVAAVIAFSFICSAMIFALSSYPYHDKINEVHYTEVGGQKNIDLADGSEIILNTDSKIEIRYTKSLREISLSRGEAHFSVAHDDHRPFIVAAGGNTVTAIGTAFAVRLHDETFKVTVTEGQVDLVRHEPRIADASTPALEQDPSPPVARLIAGDAVLIDKTNERIEKLVEAELNRSLSWRQGVLAFTGEPLSEVVEEVSRYTEVEILIKDPVLNDLRFGGYFKIGNVDSLFEALEESFDVSVRWLDQKTVHLEVMG